MSLLLRTSGFRILGHLEISEKLKALWNYCLVLGPPPEMKIFSVLVKISWKTEIHYSLFHMKTRVYLKYFVNVCGFHFVSGLQFVVSSHESHDYTIVFFSCLYFPNYTNLIVVLSNRCEQQYHYFFHNFWSVKCDRNSEW